MLWMFACAYFLNLCDWLPVYICECIVVCQYAGYPVIDYRRPGLQIPGPPFVLNIPEWPNNGPRVGNKSRQTQFSSGSDFKDALLPFCRSDFLGSLHRRLLCPNLSSWVLTSNISKRLLCYFPSSGKTKPITQWQELRSVKVVSIKREGSPVT